MYNNISYNRNQRTNKPVNKRSIKNTVDVNQFINTGNQETSIAPAYANNYAFGDMPLHHQLQSLILIKGYQKPSEIQDKSIIPILEGRDIVGIAGTGTGKTAAFLIPLIQQLLTDKLDNHALIITPTRELATQINEEFNSLVQGLDLHSTVLIGGTSVIQTLKTLKRKNHVVIGTPGRLQDMYAQRALDYSQFKVLVLDEFDRMLDMGFSREVQKINHEMKGKEQTLLFSATLDPAQDKLVREITNNPLVVKSTFSTHRSSAIDQQVVYTEGKDKFQILKGILNQPVDAKTILFCETKRHANKLLKKLINDSYSADAIHGNKSQNRREQTLSSFKSGKINILIATDVIARGIDISDVELVINYQTPKNYADYVHRIGRTGRAGKMGRAITLID
ncbi:MAG: RNA helicase [Flammeovirgaceae bacterium]|nr:RNA helicase [Flammeovirgaceae bacterium]MBE63605.1 RNA helicase [Flammeovirgaceae bacterium]MBR10444.1 RNA helicase [Rickettsiales bacterium]